MRLVTLGVVGALLSVAAAARADIQAQADVFTTPGTVDAFHHAVTLQNTGDMPISTFWYSWSDLDLNFLPSQPDAITMPDGWTMTVTECSTGYYQNTFGIEWFTTTDPILPGQASSDFSFESNDSANDLQGLSFNNYFDAGYNVATSFVFMDAPDQGGDVPAGPDFEFLAGTAVPVPEPASLALFSLALVVPLTRRRRPAHTR